MRDKIRFIMSSLWGFLQPLISILLAQVGPVLMEAAIEAVAVAATLPEGTPGAERRAIAFKLISDAMIAAGYRVAASTINAAIEVAVTRLKALEQ